MMNGRRIAGFVGFVCGVALVLAALGCASSKAPSSSSSGAKPALRLALNDWLGAQLDDTVAQILLTEQLHYTDVELIDAGTSDQFPSIKSGALHVSLEVWPSGHPDQIKQFIQEERSIEDVGLLGVTGHVGWFIPTYLRTLHPELATWQGLQNTDDIALFATPATTPKGQFTGGDPTWVQWDKQLITNLGLDFAEVFAGSEDGILSMLDAQYQQRGPLLFYFYQPHWAFVHYDLSEVDLPPYGDACWAMQQCSYPTDQLFKMVWPQLKTYAPDAYAFFQAFNFTTQDQSVMMEAVHDGQTVEQAARAWIDSHPSVWAAWIPKP